MYLPEDFKSPTYTYSIITGESIWINAAYKKFSKVSRKCIYLSHAIKIDCPIDNLHVLEEYKFNLELSLTKFLNGIWI